MSDEDERRLAAEILRWYVDAGVDLAVDDGTHDRFAESAAEAAARAAKPAAVAASAPPRRTPEDVGQDAVRAARDLAAASPDLATLMAAIRDFAGCALKTTATRLVAPDGNPLARIAFVGEAPGGEEDREGRAFVGPGGRLLDRMLASIGLDRTTAWLANVSPWRGPGNRGLSPHETEICHAFIERQIELSGAEILVCLGGAAAQLLLRQKESVTRLRGRWFEARAGARTLMGTALLHPDHLLKHQPQKRLAWRDLRDIRRRLDGLP